VSEDSLLLDGVSTDEFLKSDRLCKEAVVPRTRTRTKLRMYGEVRKVAED